MPGTRTLTSIHFITRLMANAETKYSNVTARNISTGCDVSSPAWRANIVSSETLTANATDEFLTMFMLSLVSGGMTMRNAIGSST